MPPDPTLVGKAVGRTVIVGVTVAVVVGVRLGVGVGAVGVGVSVGVGVGDKGGPTIIDWIEKPAPGVGAGPPLLPPLQLMNMLSAIALNTNTTTGETTSHFSRHDIASEAMTARAHAVKSCGTRGTCGADSVVGCRVGDQPDAAIIRIVRPEKMAGDWRGGEALQRPPFVAAVRIAADGNRLVVGGASNRQVREPVAPDLKTLQSASYSMPGK